MTDERWQLAFAIYEAAAPLAGPERQTYIHAAAPDQEMADKVLAMLDEIRDHIRWGWLSRTSGIPTTLVPSRPRAAFPNGTSLGRFVITGFVGQGGMGRVYSAHDPDLNREAALKVIAPRAAASNSENFIREAQAASALNHPNIVTVYEVIHSGSMVAIAMELVTGTSLRPHCGTAQPVEKVALWGRANRQRVGRGARPRYRPSGYQAGKPDAPPRRIYQSSRLRTRAACRRRPGDGELALGTPRIYVTGRDRAAAHHRLRAISFHWE